MHATTPERTTGRKAPGNIGEDTDDSKDAPVASGGPVWHTLPVRSAGRHDQPDGSDQRRHACSPQDTR